MRFWNKKEKIAGCFAVCDFLRAKGAEIEGYAGNSSDQDFALAVESVKTCRFCQSGICARRKNNRRNFAGV